jgi:hypothetical protein
MTHHQFDDPLKELEAALAIEPSPAFAAGVRARIAGSGSRAWWPAWQVMAAAALLAVAVMGGLVWRAGQVRGQPQRGNAAMVSAGVARVAPSVQPPTPAAMTGGRVGPALAALRLRPAPAPETIVPPDQAIAVNQLLDDLRERRTAARRATEVPLVVIEQLPEIAAVHIELIKVDLLVTNSPPAGGKEKER